MIKPLWLVALCPLVVGSGCGKSDQPAAKPGPTQPAPTQPAQTDKTEAAEPVPGTEGLRSLLTGAGNQAAPQKTPLGGLGGILGGGRGAQAGGTGTTMASDEGTMGRRPAAPPSPMAKVKMPPPAPRGGDCAAVGKRMGDMTRLTMNAELAELDVETRMVAAAMMEQLVVEVPKKIVALCEAGGWTQEIRDCVLTAGDLEAMQACERMVTPEMQAKMEAAEENPGVQMEMPAPKGSPPKW